MSRPEGLPRPSHREDERNKAATRIQACLRGHQIREKYAIESLPAHRLDPHYPTFVVGNDPCMPESLDRHHEPRQKIALVATSGMRAVSLACKLGNKENTPKIILIDNSLKVHQFWSAMKLFIGDKKQIQTIGQFLQGLLRFLKQHAQLYRDLPFDTYAQSGPVTVKYLNQSPVTFFRGLCQKYGFDYVRAVILHTTLIKQSWADESLFTKLHHVLNRLGISKIMVYASNIVACEDDPAIRIEILENIKLLSPTCAIHTDSCDTHQVPEKAFLFEKEQGPVLVYHSLFRRPSCTNPQFKLYEWIRSAQEKKGEQQKPDRNHPQK